MGLLANPRLLSNIGQIDEIMPGSDASPDPDGLELVGRSQGQVRLTADQIQDLITRYQAGASLRDLAMHYGIHRWTVRHHLQQNDIPRRGHTRKLTDEQVKQAAAKHQAGQSLASLARELNVSDRTLKKELDCL